MEEKLLQTYMGILRIILMQDKLIAFSQNILDKIIVENLLFHIFALVLRNT